MTAPTAVPRTLNRVLVVLLLVLVAGLLVPDLISLLQAGGDEWRQGDWLISTAGGMVRRGPFGDAFLWLSDTLAIQPLWVVGGVQLAASLAVLTGLGVAVLRLGAPERLVVAMFSPALLIFWINDPGSAYRKELLAFLAFLPLLLPRAGLGAGLAAVALYALAVAGHEATAFMAPLLALALWFRFEGLVSRQRLGALIAAVFALAAATVVFSLAFPTVADTAPLCARLAGYRLAPDICDGSIWWMTTVVSHNLHVTAVNLTRSNPAMLAVVYLACLAPVVQALAGSPLTSRERTWTALAALAVQPLFLIAVDWGRWMSMQAFGLTFIAVILAMRRGAPAPLRPAVLAAWMALCVLLGPHHVNLTPQGGLLMTLARQIAAP